MPVDPMTDEQLEAWEALANEATPGPLVAREGRVYATMRCPGVESCPFEDCEGDEAEHEFVVATCEQDQEAGGDIDAPLFVASRTAVPALVAEVRRLREALSNLVEASAWTHGKIVEGVGVVYPIGDAVKEARAALPPAKTTGGNDG